MRPHKIIFIVVLLAALTVMGPAPSAAGPKEASEGAATLTLTLGLNVEAEAISLDGALLIDNKLVRTARVATKTIRIVRGALLSDAVARAHTGYRVSRVLRSGAGRIIGHWITRKLTGPTQGKGREDADRR